LGYLNSVRKTLRKLREGLQLSILKLKNKDAFKLYEGFFECCYSLNESERFSNIVKNKNSVEFDFETNYGKRRICFVKACKNVFLVTYSAEQPLFSFTVSETGFDVYQNSGFSASEIYYAMTELKFALWGFPKRCISYMKNREISNEFLDLTLGR